MTAQRQKRREFEQQALPLMDELYAVALRHSRNPADAEDLVQETYLRAYAAWDRFIPGSCCRAWMMRILVNSFINGCRRRKSHRKFAARPGDEPITALYGEVTRRRAADPEGTRVEPLLGDEVSRALAELPEEHRQVVALADLEGLTYREVARILSLPVGTVMSRLFRARRHLERGLADYAASDYGIARRAA